MAENKITPVANNWLQAHFACEGESSPDNPFYRENEELYLRYDSIQIRNQNKVSGVGVEVGYYWKGYKACTFPVENIAINFFTAPNASKNLSLDGIAGVIKMVAIE